MQRNKVTEPASQDKLAELKKRVAFHEAGHAAGIHLNNKARNQPPVFFKIIKDIASTTKMGAMSYQTTHNDCIARVEGGRLIELLPPSVDSLVHNLSEQNHEMAQLVKDYMIAFESDIINLLIGPLAEAKHVADTDDELFNHQLVNLKALQNYGGSSDLSLANEYLQSLSLNEQQKNEKLDELFATASNFVNNDANWIAINHLADYILASSNNIICCEEIILMLDQSVNNFQNRRVRSRVHHNRR